MKRNFKFQISNFKLRAGFTMIELLIVIAVLGILAVAVLSAINPIEQINRSKDTGSRSDAEQLIGGIDRYYATKMYYPWQSSANSVNVAVAWTPLNSPTVKVGVDAEEMLTNLSEAGTGELKSSFVSRISGVTAKFLYIYNSGIQGESTYACFKPDSSSFRDTAWKRCTAAEGYGTLPSDYPTASACPAGGTCMGAAITAEATGCYSCLP